MSFQTRAGEQIDRTVTRALEYAKTNNERVKFDFNGVSVVVLATDTVSSIVNKWSADLDAIAIAYNNSPEGKRAAAETLLRKKAGQTKLDRLMKELTHCCKNIDTLVKWCVELSDVVRIDTEWNPGLIRQTIEAAGYERNKHVGQPPEAFDGNLQMLKEYIVGQSIDALYMGLPPHQVIHKFAEEAGL